MRYFSKSANGFFTSDVNGDNMPDDVVVVTDEAWQEILDGQLAGKIIVVDEGGYPQISNPPPLTTEELAKQVRDQRNTRLSEMDIIISNPLRWGGFSLVQQQEYSEYRQALLDVPQQAGFPDNIVWPTQPQQG